jgi:hypothetical protein
MGVKNILLMLSVVLLGVGRDDLIRLRNQPQLCDDRVQF